MNTFDFDNGAAVAKARLKTFSRPNNTGKERPLCIGLNDHMRIGQSPNQRLAPEDKLTLVGQNALVDHTKNLAPKWQAMYQAIQSGQCSQRFASGLLKLADLNPSSSASGIRLEKYAIQIAVHEVAAFASSEDRRMQLRIKKKIPKAYFPIWDQGAGSEPDSELVRFFRDSYLNLIQSGLQHLGLYLIVFSKATQSQPAFDTYLRKVDPELRTLFESYRVASLKSSRRHLSPGLASRLNAIAEQLESS